MFVSFVLQRSLRTIFGGLVAITAATACFAQDYYITNKNSITGVDVGNTSTRPGMFMWSVDGMQQLYQQWFWFRVEGTGPEAGIQTISSASVTRGVDTLTTVYGNNSFSISIDYMLKGGENGSGTASLTESIRIHNNRTTSLDFHLFQYSDFDLSPSKTDDIAALQRNLLGYFKEAQQWNSGAMLTEFVDAGVVPGANHGAVAPFSSLIDSLNDANPTTLSDTVGPVGPGDMTWAFQWDLEILAGDDALISKTKTIQVPEPGVCGFLLTGLAVLAFRKIRAA